MNTHEGKFHSRQRSQRQRFIQDTQCSAQPDKIGLVGSQVRKPTMTRITIRWSARWNDRSGSQPHGMRPVAVFGLVAGILFGAVRADNFAKIYYDASNDQLVVSMSYRGTNPDHRFSLQWGSCKGSPDGQSHTIDVQVLDNQWQDATRQDFMKTTRFSLAEVTCRPATLTLRTAPRFYSTIKIPARPDAKRGAR